MDNEYSGSKYYGCDGFDSMEELIVHGMRIAENIIFEFKNNTAEHLSTEELLDYGVRLLPVLLEHRTSTNPLRYFKHG